MKNFMKKMICTLTLAAVCLTGSAAVAVTASASGHDVQDVYVSDLEELVLYEQASYNSRIIFSACGSGYELHVMEYLNGFGYCYVPELDVNGWVDLNDISYMDTVNLAEKNTEDDEFVETRYSYVDNGFLALRSEPYNDASNVIAEIWENGTELRMTEEFVGDFGYCYVPSFGMYGWVNMEYLF